MTNGTHHPEQDVLPIKTKPAGKTADKRDSSAKPNQSQANPDKEQVKPTNSVK